MSDTTRLWRAIKGIVEDLFPKLPFSYPYRYRVFEMQANRVKLQAVRKLAGLPDIIPAVMLPGVPGTWAELTPGSTVLVQFIEGDESMPVITHFEDRDGGGWIPLALVLEATNTIKLGANATLGVARETDPVAVGTLAVSTGTLTYTPPSGPPQTGTSVTLFGAIDGASGKVLSE
jgi:hypothetical protein